MLRALLKIVNHARMMSIIRRHEAILRRNNKEIIKINI